MRINWVKAKPMLQSRTFWALFCDGHPLPAFIGRTRKEVVAAIEEAGGEPWDKLQRDGSYVINQVIVTPVVKEKRPRKPRRSPFAARSI